MCLIREFERYRPVLVSHQGFCSKGVKINNFSLYEENSAIRVENKLQDEDAQRQTVGCLKKKNGERMRVAVVMGGGAESRIGF